MDYYDKIGQKFNRLTCLSFSHVKSSNKVYWFQCDCGNKKAIRIYHVIIGHTKSCGCLVIENKNIGNKNRTHGKSRTRVYKAWNSMMTRCYRKAANGYKNYGGRGIAVCDLWRNDYLVFESWAMDNGYKPNLSLDRIDVNLGYSPENCRWITMKEQHSNKRTNRFIEYNGERLTVSQWGIKLQNSPHFVSHRLSKGWDEIRAVSTPKDFSCDYTSKK